MSFSPFQAPWMGNSFPSRGGFGITGDDTDHIYGFGTGNAGPNAQNTLGARINQTIFRDPLSRYVQQHTSGWLQDPGAAMVHILGGSPGPAPAAPPPQLQSLQATPGAVNPAGSSIQQMLDHTAWKRPMRAQQLWSGGQPNGGQPQFSTGNDSVPYPTL